MLIFIYETKKNKEMKKVYKEKKMKQFSDKD